jgi:hypothetical protein
MLAARAAVITNAACEVPCDRPGELGEGADPEDVQSWPMEADRPSAVDARPGTLVTGTVATGSACCCTAASNGTLPLSPRSEGATTLSCVEPV